jgi:hypothetical protein
VLGAILGWEDKSRTYFPASCQKALRGCIQVIADLVAKHYRPMLAGDLAVLDRVAAYASEKNAAYARQLARLSRAPCKGTVFQRVRTPPGNFRSSR